MADSPWIYIAPAPDGLWLPPSARGLPEPPPVDLERALPEELRPAPRFVPIGDVGQEEKQFGEDLIWITPTASDLGVPGETIDDLYDLIRPLPFESVMRILSVIAAELHHHPRDRERQLALIGEMYVPDLLGPIESYLAEHENAVVVDPRHVATLQRLMVTSAEGPETGDPSEGDVGAIVRALFVIAEVLPHGDPGGDAEDVDWDGWARFTVQSGLWHENPYLGDGLARMWAQYVVIPWEMSDHHAACPIDEWMHHDHGLTIADQLGLAFGLGVGVGALDDDLSLSDRFRRLILPGHFGETAFAEREEEAIKLIAADRAELRALLSGGTPFQLAWDHSALERKPFLQLADGSLLLHSPRALFAWMTRGVHYRALDAGSDPERRQGKRWLDYSGALGEEMVLRLVRRSHPEGGGVAQTAVHGEVTFTGSSGEERSPDIAITSEPAVALIEVCSGRFSLRARSTDDEVKLREEIEKKDRGQGSEVLQRCDDFLAGHYSYSGTGEIDTAYPVVVLAGDGIIQTPMLWGWLRTVVDGLDPIDTRIRRPVVLDLADLEQMLVRVEAGDSFISQLERFLASPMSELPLHSWLSTEGATMGRPRLMKEMLTDASTAGAAVLFPGSERLAAMRKQAEDPSGPA